MLLFGLSSADLQQFEEADESVAFDTCSAFELSWQSLWYFSYTLFSSLSPDTHTSHYLLSPIKLFFLLFFLNGTFCDRMFFWSWAVLPNLNVTRRALATVKNFAHKLLMSPEKQMLSKNF